MQHVPPWPGLRPGARVHAKSEYNRYHRQLGLYSDSGALQPRDARTADVRTAAFSASLRLLQEAAEHESVRAALGQPTSDNGPAVRSSRRGTLTA